MQEQIAKAEAFHALHIAGRPLLLFNIWDAGSAKAVAAAGAKALATGSASVAAAHGFEDGEAIPLDLALANAGRIVCATGLPVSLDLERGYGADAAGVAESVAAALATGIIGCNIEDSLEEGGPLRAIDEQADRIAAARAAADKAAVPLFINARTDVFFQKPRGQHDGNMLEETVKRALAYAEAGADGLFAPLLGHEALIAELVERSPLPINILALGDVPPPARLAALRVARISFGPGPFRLAMNAVQDSARQVFEHGG